MTGVDEDFLGLFAKSERGLGTATEAEILDLTMTGLGEDKMRGAGEGSRSGRPDSVKYWSPQERQKRRSQCVGVGTYRETRCQLRKVETKKKSRETGVAVRVRDSTKCPPASNDLWQAGGTVLTSRLLRSLAGAILCSQLHVSGDLCGGCA